MKNTKNFTLTAMFLAILILLAVTPLGFIPIGPINATTMHIPVIIASIVLGPRLGAFLGGTFGLISMIRSTVIQTPLSFVFSPFIPVIGTEHGSWKALLIAFIPRILIGVVPYFVYKGLRKLMKQKADSVSLFLAGAFRFIDQYDFSDEYDLLFIPARLCQSHRNKFKCCLFSYSSGYFYKWYT